MDALSDFVVAAEPAHLPDEALMLLRRDVLDSVGCAIAALDGEAVRLVRDQVESVGGQPRASLIGGGRSSVDQAALFNSVAVRYVDLLDTYLTPGGLCHPADNFGAMLAVSESTGASGAKFLLGAGGRVRGAVALLGIGAGDGPRAQPRTATRHLGCCRLRQATSAQCCADCQRHRDRGIGQCLARGDTLRARVELEGNFARHHRAARRVYDRVGATRHHRTARNL